MATRCNGMRPCLGSSALKLHGTPVGRPLPSGSLSVGRQQIMWIPTTGKAAISAAVSLSLSDTAETAGRKCHEQRQPQRSTEALLLIASRDPIPILHRQTRLGTPLGTPP